MFLKKKSDDSFRQLEVILTFSNEVSADYCNDTNYEQDYDD